MTNPNLQQYKKKRIEGNSICKKTLSGRHCFMPFSTWQEAWELKIWQAHGVGNITKCIACGMIDDVTYETK